MKRKSNYLNLLLICLFVAIAATFGGGCGGGGDVASKPSTQLAFDTDGDKMPDIFDACPEDPTRTTLDQVSLKPLDLTASKAATYAVSVAGAAAMPGTIYGTLAPSASTTSAAYDALSSESTPDPDKGLRYQVTLKAGVLYTGAFYDIKFGTAISFIPDITIYDPDGEEVDGELSIGAEENLGMVAMTITAPKDGNYIIKIRNADFTDTKLHTFAAAIYEEKGDPGNYGNAVRFRDSEGGTFIYTMRDLIYLRTVLASPYNATSYDQYGRPTAFVDNIQDIWTDALALVNSGHYKDPGYIAKDDTASAKGATSASNASTSTATATAIRYNTRLNPIVAGISWNSEFHQFSYGFTSPSGRHADKIMAVKPFTLPDGTGMAKETIETTKFISTKEEHEEEMDVSLSASYGTADAGIEASASYGKSIKYSTTSTTLALRYEFREMNYRMLGLDEYELTVAAKRYLDENGAEAFRARFGDYFVAGARYGAKCVAYVSIHTNSSEQTKSIKAAVSGHGFGAAASSDFSQKFKDVSEGCEYTIEYHEYGSSNPSSGTSKTLYLTDNGWSANAQDVKTFTATSADNKIDEVLNKMNTFITESRKPDFNATELEAYMVSFAQIQGGEDIPTRINVDPNLFAAVRSMTREFLGLTSFKNVIADIPTADITDGDKVKSNYTNKYAALRDELDINLDDICGDIGKVNEFSSRVVALEDEMRIFKERYEFYKTIKNMCNKWSEIGKDSERGFYRYPLSTTVDADIKRDAHLDVEHFEEGHVFEYTEWTSPQYDTGSGDRMWCYICINDDGGYDKHWDESTPRSFGTRYLKYHFKGWYDEDMKVRLQGTYIDMGPNRANYPFNW